MGDMSEVLPRILVPGKFGKFGKFDLLIVPIRFEFELL
jgi:hypothetical protein